MSDLSPPSMDLAHELKSISDEQIVNMALLLYLQALLVNTCGIGADWTPERRALIVKNKERQKVYEARVDGFLRYQRDESNPIMAIVEVKPCIHPKDPSSDPPNAGGRSDSCVDLPAPPATLSAYSRSEIQASIPKQSAPLGKKPSTASNFLTMHEYGPFDTGKDNHVDSLGQILLAFSIRAWQIRKEEASAKVQMKR
ncbi:unnamed protein product [Penicillium egyptiacum]|uniref:Uncharacterized protein n=1 Tax=Penicillium egyptiacum TaxID=1303716 RepID=A0A9W4K7N9_9EURO|nr:unnamed protein product [Penicillium egyptiacum]